MATPKKTAAGTWRIQIEVRGQRDAGTFDTRREAVEWAATRTAELKALAVGGKVGAKMLGQSRTLNDALKKYKEEVSPGKRGWRWEFVRIDAITTKHAAWPGKRLLVDLDAQDLIGWRDARLKEVARSTVLRDMTLVGHALETARREWGWLSENPMRDVTKPAEPDHRERIISGTEIRAMLRELGWGRRKPVRSVAQAVAHCFIAALQTGMRAGELTGLVWGDVRSDYCTLHAGRTKTGKARQVPLTAAALRNLEALRGWDGDLVFGLKSQTLDAMFRKYRTRAGLEGFTFHDARHTAATRMAQVLHVLDLCKVFGGENTARALTYYNPTGSDIAARLNAARGGSAVPPTR